MNSKPEAWEFIILKNIFFVSLLLMTNLPDTTTLHNYPASTSPWWYQGFLFFFKEAQTPGLWAKICPGMIWLLNIPWRPFKKDMLSVWQEDYVATGSQQAFKRWGPLKQVRSLGTHFWRRSEPLALALSVPTAFSSSFALLCTFYHDWSALPQTQSNNPSNHRLNSLKLRTKITLLLSEVGSFWYFCHINRNLTDTQGK